MEDELVFQLVNDPDLRKTMEDPLFTDFYLIIGEEKSVYPINLTFFSMFSLTIREFLKKFKNDGVVIEKAEYPQVSSLDFRIVHHLMTRGKATLQKHNIMGALKMASFFKINTLMNFLVDYVERNEDYIDKMDLFLFAFEANSKYLFSLAAGRVIDMGEEPFFNDKLPEIFSEEALKKLLSNLCL